MNYKVYDSVEEFLLDTEDYLLEDEVTNNLILGISYQLRDQTMDINTKPYLATIIDNNKLKLAAVITPPKPIVLYSKTKDRSGLIDFLVNHLIDDNINLPGVVGVSDLAKDFALSWSQRKNCHLEKGMDMRIYRLDQVNDLDQIKGDLRLAEEKDIELVADWLSRFDEDAGVIDQRSKNEVYQSAKSKIKLKKLFIWEDERPLSMAAKTREIKHGIVINSVFTPQNLRGRGYATACVAKLSQHLLDEGYQYCALFTDLANPTSNSIYMKIGYQPICDFNSYVFK